MDLIFDIIEEGKDAQKSMNTISDTNSSDDDLKCKIIIGKFGLHSKPNFDTFNSINH